MLQGLDDLIKERSDPKILKIGLQVMDGYLALAAVYILIAQNRMVYSAEV